MDNDWGDEKKEESRFLRKIKTDPMFSLGVVGVVGVVLAGAYGFKNRGNRRVSLYLIDLRLAAQGTLLGLLAVGLGYSIVQHHGHKLFKEK